MKAVLDSDVLIDFLQGLPEAKLEISRYGEPLYSILSWMEIMCGAQTEAERECGVRVGFLTNGLLTGAGSVVIVFAYECWDHHGQ
jgi:hypothetical protein